LIAVGTLGCGKPRRNPVNEPANLVEVTTEEGVVGEDRVAVIAGSPVFLPVVLR
jgi:hypothetical protein